MDEIFVKIIALSDYDYNLLKKFTDKDFISIDNLISIIDDLNDQVSHLEDKINEMQEPVDYEDDYSNTFDYSEWKANQE